MTDSKYDISGLDLSNDTYAVVQSMWRNKYAAYDADENIVLKGKQKMLKMKEQFPFTDADGNEVFEVNAGGMMDVAGNYVLTDTQTGEDIIILDNDFSLFQDSWTIRDTETEEELANIDSRGALVTLARNNLPFGSFIPHKYEITDASGAYVGSIDGQLISLRDRYEITIDNAENVPKEAIIAGAMVIDAIQGN